MARDEIWYNGNYYHSIWRNGEEYVQAVLSEDGQTARIVWEKKSDWQYLGSEGPISSVTYHTIVGNSSILRYSSYIRHDDEIPIQHYYMRVQLINFNNGEYTYRNYDLVFDPDDQFISTLTDPIGWYYNGYFYISEKRRLIHYNTVIKINAYTGTHEIKTDYQIVFYINGVIKYTINRHEYISENSDGSAFYYFYQNNLGLLQVAIDPTGGANDKSIIVFRTDDFSHYYAENVLEDTVNHCLCQTILPWWGYKPNLEPGSILGCSKGWLVYINSNPYAYHSPGGIGFGDGYYDYAECNLCYTEDFENYEVIDDVTNYKIDHLHTGGSISSIRFRESSSDPWTTVYIREPDGIYDTLADAIGFDDQTSMDLQDSYGVWIDEYDIFKGYYQDGSPHTGLILAENFYDILDEYKSDSPDPYVSGDGLIAIKHNDYLYVMVVSGTSTRTTLYFYCVGI